MFRIAKKDLVLFMKDRRAVMLTFLLPIFLISVFALAFGGAKREASKPSVLLVADLDRSALTTAIVQKLDSLKEIAVVSSTLADAQEEVKKGYEAAVLVFYKGFEDSVNSGKPLPMELQYDLVKEMEVGILQQALLSSLMKSIEQVGAMERVMKQIDRQYEGMDSAMIASIKMQVKETFAEDAGKQAGSKQGMKMTPLVKEKENNPGLVQAVAGTAVMMLLLSLAQFGAGLLTEKEDGTLKRLLYAPVEPGHILYGKLLSGILTAIVQLTVMFVFATLMFDLDLTGNIPGLLIMVLATAFACASFGMFLASVARTRQQLQGLSTLVVLTMSAIGGSMIPTFIMPEWMQKISVLSINYWSIQGFYDIFWRERPLAEIAVKALVLFGAGLVLLVFAVRLFKKNVLKWA